MGKAFQMRLGPLLILSSKLLLPQHATLINTHNIMNHKNHSPNNILITKIAQSKVEHKMLKSNKGPA
jgi:hypothetical protein